MSYKNNFVVGQIVKSKLGHDKGGAFFVVKVLDDNYVLIADGYSRKVENPKKKKVKHLQPYNKVNLVVAEKIATGDKLDNIELQRELEKSIPVGLMITN